MKEKNGYDQVDNYFTKALLSINHKIKEVTFKYKRYQEISTFEILY